MSSCICHHAAFGGHDPAADAITFFFGMHNNAVHEDAAVRIRRPAANRTQGQCAAGMSAATIQGRPAEFLVGHFFSALKYSVFHRRKFGERGDCLIGFVHCSITIAPAYRAGRVLLFGLKLRHICQRLFNLDQRGLSPEHSLKEQANPCRRIAGSLRRLCGLRYLSRAIHDERTV